MRGIVFDFDGPLFDSRKAARQALRATAEHFRDRFSFDVAVFNRLPLLPPRLLIGLVCAELALDPTQRDEVEKHYREMLRKAEDAVTVRTEIIDLLRNLKERRNPVGVLSARRKAAVLRRLAECGIGAMIAVCHGRDSLPAPKPHPDALARMAADLALQPADLIFVGDSEMDYQCARDARVTYYHVGWSGEPVYEAACNAAVVFKTPADLAEALLARTSAIDEMDGQSLPPELVEAIENGDLCFYAGSGISVPSGIGDWQGHYRSVLQELGAGHLVSEGMDLPELLQLLAAQPERTRRVFDRFRQSFDRPDVAPNAYHFAMLRAHPVRIWTSNYDNLFEKADSLCGSGGRVVTNDRALLEHFRHPRLVVKMNGDFVNATYADSLEWDLVFTQEQFDLVERQRPEIWRLFEDDYRNRCIVFVGVSFRDAALRRIVTLARRKIPRTRYSHLLLAKHAVEPVERWKEHLQADNLARQSITTFFFREFSAIERFVCETAIRARSPIVGFSGSFRGFEKATEEEIKSSGQKLDGGSWTAAEVVRFGERLGEALALANFRVTSGCSPVVGIPPVSAAFRVAPTRARFYLRTHGGTRYSGTAPAIVVPKESDAPGTSYDPMRRRYVSELSLLIAYGGKAATGDRTSGAIAEIEMALAHKIPVLIVPQAGGAVAAYRATFLASIDRSYSDPVLAREIRRLNDEVATVAAENLETFARGDLLDGIKRLMRQLFESSLPVGDREEKSTDW